MENSKSESSFQRSLGRLNSTQQEAVAWRGGPLLVLAGAGSGKTTTMAHRIASLILQDRVSAPAILGLSFTNKAALELKERVLKLTGIQAKKDKVPLIATFHSLSVRILRVNATRLGFQPNFTILDSSDQLDLVKSLLKQLNLDDRQFDANRLVFEMSQIKNTLDDFEESKLLDFLEHQRRLPEDYLLATANVFPKYLASARALNALDFDDLIYWNVRLLTDHPELRLRYQEFFREVLVDEYQDTNATQFRLLRLLRPECSSICVVGDDDQSIYAWRGARSEHILEFDEHYPGAKKLTLDQNYRSTNQILKAANAVISQNSNRFEKNLWSSRGEGIRPRLVVLEDDRIEAQWVMDQLLERNREQNISYNQMVILYRSNTQSRIFEEELRRCEIPYEIVGGLSFFERKEIKDSMAFLRILVNSKDDPSMRRIINWPSRGIGRSSLQAIGDFAFKTNVPIFVVLKSHLEELEISSQAKNSCSTFLSWIEKSRYQLLEMPAINHQVSLFVRDLFINLGFQAAFLSDSSGPNGAKIAAKKWDNVEELCHSLGAFELKEARKAKNGLELIQGFVCALTLQSLDLEDKKSPDDKQKERGVTLLTLHGSKGLEFSRVFLVGLEEGLLPHKRVLEGLEDLSEERRLFYVGMTRAKDELVMTRARVRIRYGKPVPRNPSRFLDTLSDQQLDTQDLSASTDPQFLARQKELERARTLNQMGGLKALLEGMKT